MKKLILLLIIILGLSLTAFAVGAQKVEFAAGEVYETADDGAHANANGFVIINETPEGANEVIIQIQIRDAAPEYEYRVKSGAVVLGNFVTNKNGQGKFHCNLPSMISGAYINIWDTSSNTVVDGRLLRVMIP